MKNLLLFLFLLPLSLFANDGKVNFNIDSATDVITVQLDQQGHAVMVQIVSQDGNVVWTEHTKEKEFKLDLSSYPAGVFTVKVSVYDRVESHQFVKRKS